MVTQRGLQAERYRHPEAADCSTTVPGSQQLPFGSYCGCTEGTEIAGPRSRCASLKEFDSWVLGDSDYAGCRCEKYIHRAVYSKAEVLKILEAGTEEEFNSLLPKGANALETTNRSFVEFVENVLIPELVHFSLRPWSGPNATDPYRLDYITKALLGIGRNYDVVKPILLEMKKWPCGKRGGMFELIRRAQKLDWKHIINGFTDFFKTQATCLQNDAHKLADVMGKFETLCFYDWELAGHAAYRISNDWNFLVSVLLPAIETFNPSAISCTISTFHPIINNIVSSMSLADFLRESSALSDYRLGPVVIPGLCWYRWFLDDIRDSPHNRSSQWNHTLNASSDAAQDKDGDIADLRLVRSLKSLLTSNVTSHRALVAYIASEDISLTSLKLCQAEISDLLGDADRNVRFAGAQLIGNVLQAAGRAKIISAFEDVLRRSRLYAGSLSEILSDPQSSSAMIAGAARLKEAGAQHSLSTSRNLSKQVGTLIACTADDIMAPPGFMVVAHHSSGAWEVPRAFRCPQPWACNGTRSLKNCSAGEQSMCAKGYDTTVPGCAACEKGFGRQPLDPFTCRPCGRHDLLQKAGYVLLPTILFAAGMHSASKAKKDLAGGMLNIILSFAMSAFIVINALEGTQAFQTLAESAQSAAQVASSASGAGSALYSSSFDCLVGEKLTTLSQWTLLSLGMPVLIFVMSLLAVLLTPTGQGSSWWLKLLRPTLVASNTFLPGILAAFLRFGACVHLQEDEGSSRAYEMSSPCNSDVMDFVAVLGIVSAACVLGPLYWAVLIHKAKHWDPRVEQDVVGYLINAYKDDYQWWGAVMLLRKLTLAALAAAVPISYAPKSHIGAATVVMVASLMAHVYWQPFKSPVLNVVEGCSLAATCTSMALADLAIGGEQNWSTTAQTGQRAVVVALATVALNGGILVVCFLKVFFAPATVLPERRGPLLRRSTVH